MSRAAAACGARAGQAPTCTKAFLEAGPGRAARQGNGDATVVEGPGHRSGGERDPADPRRSTPGRSGRPERFPAPRRPHTRSQAHLGRRAAESPHLADTFSASCMGTTPERRRRLRGAARPPRFQLALRGSGGRFRARVAVSVPLASSAPAPPSLPPHPRGPVVLETRHRTHRTLKDAYLLFMIIKLVKC